MHKLFTYVMIGVLFAAPSYALEATAPLTATDGTIGINTSGEWSGNAAGTTGYQTTFVCDNTDQSTALGSAISTATGTVVLTGASCKFSNVQIKSDIHITCASNTVLRAINATNPMFKRGDSFIQNWSVTDCTVSMEGYHTEFLDVGYTNTSGTYAAPATGTEGNTGWLVDNVKVSFSDGTISDSGTGAFAYFNLSCDPKQGSTNAGQSCAFTNNRILGSINSAYSGSANANANDTGVNFLSAREIGNALLGPDSLLISQNNITLVEGAAASFAFRSDLSTDSGGYVYATISDNVFSTHSSETPIIDTSDPAAGSPVGVSYSQITGNTFAVNSATSEGWFAKLDGGNNQIVGNTFKPGTTPVIGNGANFVGNYTATGISGEPITACKNYAVNTICAHVSFVGNVATGRFEVYNPDDLVISSNKFLGADVGVDLIRKFTSASSANVNKIRSISVMGNTFALGASSASNSLGVINFKVDSGDNQSTISTISDVQITGNVLGKSGANLPNFCINGGNEGTGTTKLNYAGFQVLDNILGCKYPGWDGAAAGTTGQTFDGTLETYAFCGNADRTTEGLVQSCASDKEQRVPLSGAIPAGIAVNPIDCWRVGSCSGGTEAGKICNANGDCAGGTCTAPIKQCSVSLVAFPKISLHDTVYFASSAFPDLAGFTGPVNAAGNLSEMRCRLSRAPVLPAICALGAHYPTWGRKVELRKNQSAATNMSCEFKGCDESGGSLVMNATQCTATGNVDIVATDEIEIFVTEIGTNAGTAANALVNSQSSTVTCEFDWKQS